MAKFVDYLFEEEVKAPNFKKGKCCATCKFYKNFDPEYDLTGGYCSKYKFDNEYFEKVCDSWK